ncbi:MAG TPA: hypothetical protein VGQ99_02790 [Tepidisphaeraceae bacterium]|nr:hypothetical protein [Tepidisphaeraceae bacterium]
MRNGFLLLLLIVCAGCSHQPDQYETIRCGFGDGVIEARGTPSQSAAADRAAAEAWRAQQERLINASNPK